MYGGIEFPDGSISFADSVVSYDPGFGGGNTPTDPNFTDPSMALGIPDYANPIGTVALGAGGRLVLQFVDNFLTGSDDSGADLHIFEIGPNIEHTTVDISVDGLIWTNVGTANGSTSSIDIDQFGFNSSDLFSYVRLTDVRNQGSTGGPTVGADIDAVGAISTAPSAVPDASSSILLACFSAFGLISFRRWLKQ